MSKARTIGGRYRLGRLIGAGGAGSVFLAQDERLGRQVAVKLLSATGPEGVKALKRLKRESTALAKLDHPHVVRVFELVDDDGQLALVLEFVAGGSLQERLDERGPLTVEQTRVMGLELASALQHAHEQGILHRDLKPGNVLLDPRVGARLTDFGLTRTLDASLSQTQLSVQGQFLGSPGYWAPEQARGQSGELGPHTDVYGLGATLYAALTGAPPHGEPEGLFDAVGNAEQPAPPIRGRRPEVPAWLEQVLAGALAVDPTRRYATAEEFASALRAGRGGPGSLRVPAVAAGLVVFASFVAAGLLLSRQVERRPSAPPSASSSASASQPAAGPASLLSASPPPAARPSVATLAAPSPVEDRTAQAAQVLFAKGLAARREGKLEGAISLLQRAIALDPERSGPRIGLGMAYREQGRLDEAREALEAAYALGPDKIAAYDLGIVWADLGQHQLALRLYQEVLDLDPDHAPAAFASGLSHLRLDSLTSARRAFERTLEIDPGYGEAAVNLGNLATRAGLHEEALAWFDKALAGKPTLAVAAFNRANALSRLKRWDEARTAYHHTLELDSEYADAYYGLALMELNVGGRAAAMAAIDKALRLEPDNSLYLELRRHVGDGPDPSPSGGR